MLQAIQLQLEVLTCQSDILLDDVAESCRKVILTLFKFLVYQDSVYLQGGFAQLRLALATIRAGLGTSQPLSASIREQLFADACRLVVELASSSDSSSDSSSGVLQTHLPDDREFWLQCGH